jgi:hypothetical protein
MAGSSSRVTSKQGRGSREKFIRAYVNTSFRRRSCFEKMSPCRSCTGENVCLQYRYVWSNANDKLNSKLSSTFSYTGSNKFSDPSANDWYVV